MTDWEGGFIKESDIEDQQRDDKGDEKEKELKKASSLSSRILKKENFDPSWKGKELAVQREIDDDTSINLMMMNG